LIQIDESEEVKLFAETRAIEITHIGAAVPSTVKQIIDFDFHSKEALARAIKSTGVKEVRYSTADQTASDLCLAPAKKILEVSKLTPQAIVFVSSTPDYLSTATSPILQTKLGLAKSTICFDINYGCSGFIYGLFQAALILASVRDVETVLVLVGETPTKNIDLRDPSTALIFGDSGTATLVRRSERAQTTKFFLQANGDGFDAILKRTGGYRSQSGESCLHMDGAAVMNFIVSEYQPTIADFFSRANLKIDDINKFYFHQANKLILEYISKKLKVPSERVPTSYDIYGNTGGGSLPLTIAMDILKDPSLNTESKPSLLSGFGAGLSWGHALLDLRGCVSVGVMEL